MSNFLKVQKQLNSLHSQIVNLTLQTDEIVNNTGAISVIGVQAIQQSLETASDQLTILSNAIAQFSAELSAFDRIALAEQIESLNDTIIKLQWAITNVSIPPDPYSLHNETFLGLNEDQLYQQYDKIAYRLNMVSVSSAAHYMQTCFAVKQNSTGTIKLQFDYVLNSVASAFTVQLYLNGTLWNEETVSVTELDTIKTYSFHKYDEVFSSAGNTISLKIILSNANTIFTLKYYRFEIIGWNADITNKLCPVSVATYNGSYLIADATSGTAKLAQQSVENLMKLSSVNFSDSQLTCNSLQQIYLAGHSSESYVFTDRVLNYVGEDGKVHLLNTANDATITINSPYCELFEQLGTQSYPIKIAALSLGTNLFLKLIIAPYSASLSGGGATTFTLIEKPAKVTTVKHTESYLLQDDLNAFIVTESNGQNTIFSGYSGTPASLNLGYGTNATAYLLNYQSATDYKVEVFLKVYDRLVRKTCHYQNGTWTLLSEQKTGRYDWYLKGVNGDYFVLRKDELQFYKYHPEF